MLKHLAIIMDGNGRWAAERGLPRTAGHAEGVKAVKHALTGAVEAGIDVLTLYSFSAENWKRPTDEIAELMRLHREYLASEAPTLHQEGVRLRFMGDINKLEPDLYRAMKEAEALTAHNSRITLNMAMNYGSQQEIVQACRTLAAEVVAGTRSLETITVETLGAALFCPDLPPPDLLLRTSGEVRLSNFMLWQVAYSELLFTSVLWPDFRAHDIHAAVAEYNKRERRYGGV